MFRAFGEVQLVNFFPVMAWLFGDISKIYLPGPRSGEAMSFPADSFGSLLLHTDISLSYFILLWRQRFAI